MDYIKDKLKLSTCVLLFCMVIVGFGQGARAAGDAASSFQKANQDYADLLKDAQKKKIKDNWLKVINKFMDVAEKYPDTSLAPEAYAKGAKVYEHFSRYSGNKGDVRAASKVYQDLARKYPRSSLADDALYNAGLLEERAGNREEAAKLYRRILDEYAQGDMTENARAKLGVKAEAAAAQKPPAEKPAEQARKEEPEQKKADPVSRIKRLRSMAGDDTTRVVVEIDSFPAYKAFVAPEEKSEKKPVRLVIDLKGSRIAAEFPARQEMGEGIVSAIRVAQHPDNMVRIVLDLREKPAYEISKMEDPNRIAIDVSPKGAPKPSPVAKSDPPDQVQEKPPVQSIVKKVPPGSPSQMKGDVPSIASQLCLKVSRIVVDPGHGGKDPGAISHGGIREKDITLEIGKLLARRLKEDGFEVYLTRTRDEFLALEERTNFANKKRADLFLSLHINSHQNNAVSGIETYFLNLTTDSSAIQVAQRENAYTDKSMSDLQLILNDLMLNSKINESSKFATCVHTNVLSSAQSTGYDGKNLGVRQAPFYVLLGAQMPSILIELGFLTNPTDITMLRKHSYQETLVDGIAKGINSYIMNTTYAYGWRNK